MTAEAQAPIAFASSQKFVAIEHAAVDFALEMPLNAPPSRELEPDFYKEVANRLGVVPGSIIRVYSESPPSFSELLVRSVNRIACTVTVALLRRVGLEDPHANAIDDGLPSGHSVKHLGPISRWAVLRGQQSLKDGFATKAEALEFAQALGRRV